MGAEVKKNRSAASKQNQALRVGQEYKKGFMHLLEVEDHVEGQRGLPREIVSKRKKVPNMALHRIAPCSVYTTDTGHIQGSPNHHIAV